MNSTMPELKTGMLVRTDDDCLRLIIGNTAIAHDGIGGGMTLNHDGLNEIIEIYAEPVPTRGFNSSLRFWLKDEKFLDTYGSNAELLWKKQPELEVDTKVIVWDKNGVKANRHFSHFEDGKIHIFMCGSTSWSETATVGYDHWEVA